MQRDLEELKNKLRPIYADLGDICNRDNLCPLVMQWGDEFPTTPNDGIIFYGRATNGWDSSWDLDILFSDKNRDHLEWMEQNENYNPNKYNPNRSPFLRIIKGISTEIYKDKLGDKKWYQFVAWSNICKVAPRESGNPSDKVFYATLDNNIKAFRAEVDFLSPKYIVLLTDGIARDNKPIDWTSYFINSFNDVKYYDTIPWGSENKIKIKVYKSGNMFIILSVHPQGREERPHRDAIINIIEKIEQQKL